MASRRTKSIGTKVTPEEYARIQTLAGEQPASEWVRAALLKAAEPPSADATVLAELLALRAILLNLHFHLCSGAPVTVPGGELHAEQEWMNTVLPQYRARVEAVRDGLAAAVNAAHQSGNDSTGAPGLPPTWMFFRNSVAADLIGALLLLAIYNAEAICRRFAAISQMCLARSPRAWPCPTRCWVWWPR